MWVSHANSCCCCCMVCMADAAQTANCIQWGEACLYALLLLCGPAASACCSAWLSRCAMVHGCYQSCCAVGNKGVLQCTLQLCYITYMARDTLGAGQ